MIKIQGNNFTFAGKTYSCSVGKKGFSDDKKEGDGKTPFGIFPLRELWCRADKIKQPDTQLPVRIITQNDGWCDDINSPDYNKHIILPYNFSHEKLWREDDVYDLIIPLGYNDSSIIKGKGSAIFLHIAKPDYSGTEGCVALAKNDLLEILPFLSKQVQIEIRAE